MQSQGSETPLPKIRPIPIQNGRTIEIVRVNGKVYINTVDRKGRPKTRRIQ